MNDKIWAASFSTSESFVEKIIFLRSSSELASESFLSKLLKNQIGVVVRLAARIHV